MTTATSRLRPSADSSDSPPGLGTATVIEAFQRTAHRCADDPALCAAGSTTPITWREYAEQVRSTAEGLATLDVHAGDVVALMLVNRPEFHVVDMAVAHLGAASFSAYNTLPAAEIAELLANSTPRVLVTEQRFLEIVRSAVKGSSVERIVVVDGPADGAITLAELQTMGRPDFDFDAVWRAVRADDVLTLIYTSGTTGSRKGVQLTHRNVLSVLTSMCEIFGMQRGGRGVSYLPAAHIADRWAFHYFPIILGAEITDVADPTQVMAAVAEVRPTYWGGVPRTWEKIAAALQASGVNDPASLTDPQKAAVLEKIGLDQARFTVVGAAPMQQETLQFFLDLGLPVCEVWGMSETAGLGTINPPHKIKPGSVGIPMGGLQARLLADGELVVRGPLVMRGYHGEPQKTAEVIDDEGWLHTGDVADIDEDGYITIIDRKKELIINSGGKNMSPVSIEGKLKAASPLIGQAMAIGDRRPYNVALIVPEPEALKVFCAQHGIKHVPLTELVSHPQVLAEIRRGVDAANARMARVEQIKKFTVLPSEWTSASEELTPTLKLRRRIVIDKYSDEINDLYEK